MIDPAAPVPGRIFISYRREETAYPAGWLYDRLADRYGGQVFKDVDSIELGDDFVEVITRAVGSCDVLLALVGEQWLTITNQDGRRRLDDPDDFVRLEIEAALTRNVRVVPILVDGARLPRADELPPSLARLVRRQALELSPARFDFDTSRLLRVLDRTLAEVRAAPDGAATMPSPAAAVPDAGATQAPASLGQRDLPEPSTIPIVPPADPAAPSELHEPPADNVSPPASHASPPASNASRIFEDDFSALGSGWRLTENGRGLYSNGAYRLAVPPSKDGSSPWTLPHNARSVYPQAPRSLAVAVDARSLSGAEGTGYGIVCRASENGTAYAFGISGDDSFVTIAKMVNQDPWVKILSE
jgi:hypothetical protein